MKKSDRENNVLIITGGHIEEEFLKNIVTNGQYNMIIAVDRGLVIAHQISLEIDFIVGDFDSVPMELLKKYQERSTQILSFPPEKDKTDTQIAIELALMHNATNIDMVGATGSRLDHVLGNIHLLMLPLQLNVKANIIDPNNKIYLTNKSVAIQRKNQYGTYVSILPFYEKVTGLTLKGFKYPLKNVTLSAGSSLGISNEMDDDLAIIDFADGIIIVMETKDES